MDIIEKLSRRCYQVCPHLKGNREIERCPQCDVIVYDRYSYNIQDSPFDEILVASPRYKKLPDSEIVDITERFRAENELIAADLVAGKLRTQKEYIDAQIATSAPGKSTDTISIQTVSFKENVVSNLKDVFPKRDSCRAPPTLLPRLTTPPRIAEEETGISLGSPSSLNRSQIRVYVDPFGPDDYVSVYIDPSVRVAEILGALMPQYKGVLRWVEEDEETNKFYPDYDLPTIDPDQLVVELGTTTLSLTGSDT